MCDKSLTSPRTGPFAFAICQGRFPAAMLPLNKSDRNGGTDMVITIANSAHRRQASKATSIAGASKSAPLYREVKGLIRKDFLNGEDGGGEVYLWESRAAAEAGSTTNGGAGSRNASAPDRR